MFKYQLPFSAYYFLSNFLNSFTKSVQTYPYFSFTFLAISKASELGIGSFLSCNIPKTNLVMSLPAKGMCLTQLPIIKPSATGNTWVTPSPESMTIPVRSYGDNLSNEAADPDGPQI